MQSTNHITSVPNLHTLAKTYALADAYSTGTQPPSGPNHWWLFSGQSSSSSQQQSYPAATGTQFDRFLKGDSGGTFPFIMNGDFYWMLSLAVGEAGVRAREHRAQTTTTTTPAAARTTPTRPSPTTT